MKLVKCGKCGAQFDVASMRPGSTFPCGKCRGSVSVPAESAPATVALAPDQMKKALEEARAGAAAPKGQPKLPPAMQARAQATSASAPTRAAGATPAAAPAAAAPVAVKAAPRAARPRDAGAAPEGRSPAMTYAIIGGIVVAGIVAAVVLTRGDKSKDSPAPAPIEPPKPAEPPAPPPKPKDPSNVDDYLTLPADEQNSSLVARFVSMGGDAAQLQALLAWCRDTRLAGNAAAKSIVPRIVAKALESDPDCEWARTENGEKRIRDLLQGCRDQCSLAFTMPDPPENAVIARLDTVGEKPWADAAEWKKYEEIVAKVRERNTRMTENPRYLAAEKKRDWVRSGTEFKGVEMTWIFADPYVIFQEVKKQDVRDTKLEFDAAAGGKVEKPIDGTSNPSKVKQNEAWLEKGRLFAKRDGIIFNELNRRFRELFADEFKLDPLETCGPEKKGRILTGLVMWNRRSFDKLLEESGNKVSPFIRAFYSPPQQKIFHYLGDDSLQSLDEVPTEGGYVQKGSDQVTFHEGTHQLQHEYTAIFNGHPLQDNVVAFSMRGRSMWFEEGIAEFMGAAEVETDKAEFLEGAKWRHNRILLSRIVESRNNRDNVEKWTLKDFLKPTSNEDLQTMGEKLAPGHGAGMPSHFYCRAWALCHFLWYYDNGRYRPKFMNYFRELMKGSWSIEKFAKDMGRPNVNDWGNVEKEFEWYWNQLLARKVVKSKVTGKWSTPSSEAPTGKVEDDPDFCESWDEAHKGGKK